jgi:hypothetical protein
MSGKKPPRAPKKDSKDKRREHREDLLDEALDETFPASDPPAITRPHPPEEEE